MLISLNRGKPLTYQGLMFVLDKGNQISYTILIYQGLEGAVILDWVPTHKQSDH
jgi:hypothetical protein